MRKRERERERGREKEKDAFFFLYSSLGYLGNTANTASVSRFEMHPSESWNGMPPRQSHGISRSYTTSTYFFVVQWLRGEWRSRHACHFDLNTTPRAPTVLDGRYYIRSKRPKRHKRRREAVA
ncbi:hypothetical protein LX36DRAFT_121970 [Colletotrichum falcatum]|nr:hypothetical protein LX36DRAFT_121970 [Colletotrichum falcatum]